MRKYLLLALAAMAAFVFSCEKPVPPEEQGGNTDKDPYKETVLEGFKLNGVVADGMVIQRGKPFTIWGTATRKVKVFAVPSWDPENIYIGEADKYGSWSIDLPEVPYVEDDPNTYSVKIYNKTFTTGIRDLIVGDVWLLTGQSNMGISVAETVEKDLARTLESGHRGKIRYCCPTPVSGAEKAQQDFTGISHAWATAGVQNMSAVGYFFAQKIYEKTKVPIGLLNVCMGGTTIQTWFPSSLFENDAKLHEDWAVYGTGSNDYTRVAGWYNSRVHPARYISCCGFLWYQGEGNANEYEKYPYAQVKLMECWRELFRGDGNMPFYYVQLAPYEDGDFINIRYAQGSIREMTTATGMAVILDRGEAKNIHPTRKADAGQRAAYIALNQYYGQSDVKYLGPQYDGFTVSGNTVKIKFKNAEGLKTSDGLAPKYFELSLDEGASYFEVEPEINGEEIWITRPDINEDAAGAVAVRYAWVRCPETNLYNGAGLPAEQFTSATGTDDSDKRFIINGACSNNMVIQRGKPFHVWGHAFEKGIKVYAKASWDPDHIYSGVAGDPYAEGDYNPWCITLPEPPFAEDDYTTYTVTVYNKSGTKTLSNLIVGDVWVLCGQSNMGISVAECAEKSDAYFLAGFSDGRIRFLTPGVGSKYDTPQIFYSGCGDWGMSNGSIDNASAVGYFFGAKIYDYTSVPIGLFNVCMGGCTIQTFIPKTAFDADPKLAEDWKQYANHSNSYYKNSAWYNSRVHPGINMSICGFLWYQGEGNVSEYEKYPYAQKALMDSWRELFGCPDAPFYYIQLAPYGDSDGVLLRNAQGTIRDLDNNTGMAVILDLGDETNIHPTRKRLVGERAADIALNRYYGMYAVPYLGPRYKSLSLSDGAVTVSFDHADGLMTPDGSAPKYFELSLDGGATFSEAAAEIVGSTIVLRDSAVKAGSDVVVRYAWKKYLETNLYNGDGLPAEQFISK
ncbi:MAG: sialate O-acetylesterase [Bacteroidales bacterium]|nr:sialate O-acetylesterase [Bacteroidales bacterium]